MHCPIFVPQKKAVHQIETLMHCNPENSICFKLRIETFTPIRAENKFLTTKLQIKMKKFYGILLCMALMAFKTNVQAQTCSTVSTVHFQSSTGYYGVRVSMANTYTEHVTVTGWASDPNHPFSLTIYAGNLSAETDATFYESSEPPIISVSTVSPCPESEIEAFTNSSDFSAFTGANQTIASKINYAGGQVRNDSNRVLNGKLKTILLPVIESNEDTSGIIIGIADPSNAGQYLIIYQNNQSVSKTSDGYYYGEVGYDLFNSETSYTIHIDANSEYVSDSLFTGPRWINNSQSSSLFRAVTPTWACIDNVMDTFWSRCTGWCRFFCRVSDQFLLSCTGGQYIGAATWCASHNNNFSTY